MYTWTIARNCVMLSKETSVNAHSTCLLYVPVDLCMFAVVLRICVKYLMKINMVRIGTYGESVP